MTDSKNNVRNQLSLTLPAAALLLVGIVMAAVGHGNTRVALVALALRWAAVGLLVIYGLCKRSLTPWIFVAMVAGTELGLDAPKAAIELRVLSDIFLRLIKTIVAPLILATLVTAIAGHGDLKGVGRMAWKSLVYFEVVTTLALVIGLVAINLTRAGVGLNLASTPVSATPAAVTPPMASWQELVLHVFPENIAKSIAEGQILQVAVFAVIFGIALAGLSESKRAPVLRLAEGISETMFKFTNIVMYLAPLAVGAALAYTVGTLGAGVLIHLGKLILSFYGALAALMLLVMLPVMLLLRIPVGGFVRAVSEAATISFATSASEGALPGAMESMEAFGVPRKIVAFVLPAGYSFNMDGAAVYLTLASIFVAQAAGMHPGLREQIEIVLILMLISKGVGGVPRATLMVLVAAAATLRLPMELVSIMFGIDAIMDMGRAAVNVIGNCLATVVVAKWEGEFRSEKPSAVVLEGTAE